MDSRTVPPPLGNLPLFSVLPYEEAMRRGIIVTAAPSRLTPSQHGMAGADDSAKHLPDAVKRDVLAGIASFKGQPWTTDTLRGKLSQSSRDVLALAEHRNGLQGMVTTLAKSGAIVFTGSRVKSVRPSARGRELKVWRAA